MTVWLAWIEGLRQPSPQKLSGDAAPFVDEEIRGRVLGSPRKLDSSEADLSLDELAFKYPAPPKQPEASAE